MEETMEDLKRMRHNVEVELNKIDNELSLKAAIADVNE